MLETIDGHDVSRTSTENALASFRVPNCTFSTTSSPITDPYAYAEDVYGGSYSAVSYVNKWEDYITCHNMNATQFSDYEHHCGPIAISTLIEAYGDRENVSSITNKTFRKIFDNVVTIGIASLYYSETFGGGGTQHSKAGDYIIASFSTYGIDYVITTKRSLTYSRLRSTLNNDYLAYLMLEDHDCYSDHHVLCYACNRIENNDTGDYISFAKVADGWATSPRYIDLDTCSGYEYWEVNFDEVM